MKEREIIFGGVKELAVRIQEDLYKAYIQSRQEGLVGEGFRGTKAR